MSRLLYIVGAVAVLAVAGCAEGTVARTAAHREAPSSGPASPAGRAAAAGAPRAPHAALHPARQASTGAGVPPASAPAPPGPAVAEAPASSPTRPIVALGDSITYGFGTGAGSSAFGPPPEHSYPWDLARRLHEPVVNAGVSGTTAYGLLDPSLPADSARPVSLRLPALLAMHPRLMIVGFGSNEAIRGWPIRETAHDLDLVLDRITGAGVPVVLIGTHVDCFVHSCRTDRGYFRQRYTEDWDSALAWLGAKYAAPVVDDVESGFGSEDLTDWIHPSAQGYELIAERVAPAVLHALGAGDAPPGSAQSASPAAPPRAAGDKGGGADEDRQRREPPRPESIWDGNWGARSDHAPSILAAAGGTDPIG